MLCQPGVLWVDKCWCFFLMSYFEVLAVSSPHSAAGSQVESFFNTAFLSERYIPSCVSLVGHATVGVRGCISTVGVQTKPWVVPGLQD